MQVEAVRLHGVGGSSEGVNSQAGLGEVWQVALDIKPAQMVLRRPREMIEQPACDAMGGALSKDSQILEGRKRQQGVPRSQTDFGQKVMTVRVRNILLVDTA